MDFDGWGIGDLPGGNELKIGKRLPSLEWVCEDSRRWSMPCWIWFDFHSLLKFYHMAGAGTSQIYEKGVRIKANAGAIKGVAT